MMKMNMKVGTRLAAGFGMVVLLMIGITMLGITRLGALNDSTSLIVNDRYPKVAMANAVLTGISDTAILMRNMLILDDPEKIKSEMANLLEIRKGVVENLDKLDKALSTEKGKQIYKAIVDARAKYAVGQTEFLKLIGEGKKQEASSLLLSTVMQDQQAYINEVKGLVKLGGTLMEKSGEEAASNFRSASNLMAALTALATLLACGFAYWTTRSITVPLNRAVQVARTVAAGDLTSEIDAGSTDETGQLIQALKDMNDSLVSIVSQVRSGTDAIVTASSQISAGNLDLSSRTEEQASSLEETASSMEELTSTVKQNDGSATQANQLAQSASSVALKGGEVVAQVVDTMGSINDSSRRIADIIGVIDGIAFQTNILALNAAVEAARAGEQGRGFAVVATEVRSLAQRSAAAAKEIKVLIDDSVGKVDAGSKLVAEAGTTMNEVVESIRRVTDIMGEITAASSEQSAEIEQVNRAIGQMDDVTQQNAALVEEAAAAAASLHDQSANLLQVVSLFKLNDVHLAGAIGMGVDSSRLPEQKKEATVLIGANFRNPKRSGKQGFIADHQADANERWEAY
jgi:methyl-accepting chemotaxis protein